MVADGRNMTSAERTRSSRFGHRGLLTRGPLGVASQALNSLSNLLVAVAVARVATPSEYGAWALGYTAYVITLHLTRAVASTPLMLSGDASQTVGRPEASGGTATASLMGLAAGGVLVGIAAATGFDQPLTESLLVFAGVLPLLLGHDVLRNVCFRDGRAGTAALLDLTWIVVQVGGTVVLSHYGALSVMTGTLAWAAGALVSAGWGIVALHIRLHPWLVRDFLRRERHVSARLMIDSGLAAGSSYLAPVLVAMISGLAATGALRAGQTLMGGISIVVMGLTPVLTLESRRSLQQGVRPRSIVLRWSAFIAAASAIYGGVVLFLPDRVGEALVGHSWTGASALLLPLVLLAVARGPYTAVPVILKARRDLNGLLLLRLRTVIPSLLCPLIGALAADAEGAAWGLMVSAFLTDALSIRFLQRRGVAGDAAMRPVAP